MPINKYNCTECDFSEEYVESFSTSKENWHPEVCPKCEKGKLEKVFDLSGHRIGIDFVGPGFYVNDYGPKNWKMHLSKEDQIKVLTENKDPY